MVCSNHLSMEVISQFFKSFPLILPTFLALVFSSRSSLKSLLAVQSLDSPKPISIKTKKYFKRKAIGSLILLLTLITLIEYFTLNSELEIGTVEKYAILLFGFSINSATILFLADLTRTVRWAAYRHSIGIVIFKPVLINYYKLSLIILTSTYLNYQFYISPSNSISTNSINSSLLFLTSTALIYRFNSSVPVNNHSVRKVIIMLTGFLFSIIIFSVAMVMLITKYGNNEPVVVVDDSTLIRITMIEDGNNEEVYPFSKEFKQIYNLFINSIISAIPGLFITVCFRFDYHQSQKRSLLSIESSTDGETEALLTTSSNPHSIQLETISPPSCKAIHLSTGVISPLRAPRFSRPIYFTALLSWFLTYILSGLAFYNIPILISIQSKVDSSFDSLTLLISIPITILSTLLMARMRGELKDLWCYKESWRVSMIMEGDEEQVVKEEVLPVYEDIVKEKVDQVEFEEVLVKL